MTAHALARRILEADDDLDINSEVKRLTGTAHPGVEIEVVGNHWDVYRSPLGRRTREPLGSVHYNDPNDIPPEASPHWQEVSWGAFPLSPRIQGKFFKTFDEAVGFLASIRDMAEAEEIDPEDIPEPDYDPAKEIERYTTPLELLVTNQPGGHPYSGRSFLAEITWPAGEDRYKKIQPLIHFYDQTYKNDDWPKGQPTGGRYYAASIAGHRKGVGLSLYNSEPAWFLDPQACDQVIDWINAEMTKRGYKLKGDWLDHHYESIDDPDNPELYTNPERHRTVSKRDAFAIALKEMLSQYYDQVDVTHKPNRYGFEKHLKDWTDWVIRCKRNTPLPLANRTTSWYVYRQQVDWRKELENWLSQAAQRHQLILRRFQIMGRVRQDPVFTFETYSWLGESIDDPDMLFGEITGKLGWDKDLQQDLWKFHPYGCGYSVSGGHSQGSVGVWTYFPAEERDAFAERVKNFVVKWINDHRIMNLTSVQMTKWDQTREGGYHYNGFNIWLNIPFDVNKLYDGEAE